MLSDEIQKVHNRLGEMLHTVDESRAAHLRSCRACLADCADMARNIERNLQITQPRGENHGQIKA